MRQYSTLYTIIFSAAVCIVCSLLVSTSAVSLKARQEHNALLNKQESVLMAAGLIQPDEKPTRAQITELFKSVKAVVIDLKTGKESVDTKPETFDQLRATKDPKQSAKAPPNNAGIARLPNQALIYQVLKENKVDEIVLPIEGKGLWSTLYGFLALDADGTTIRGITFYQHYETPGLGGEVDNPKWKALWRGRHAFDENFEPKIEVIKGKAKSPAEDPYRVDGLSGATLTSRGVSHLVRFWLGENGFGPYLRNLRKLSEAAGLNQ